MQNLETTRQFPYHNPQHRININQEYVRKRQKGAKGSLMKLRQTLTEEQRHAVVKDEDSNLVIASAGSGKTSVIVAKAAWLIEKD